MTKDLTNSSVHRQNILNNPYALQEIEKATRISGIPFEGKSVVLKEQVAAFFEVTPRTVDNYIEKYGDELRRNGYEVIRGNRLKTLKLEISARGDNETDFVIKTNVLGIFDFRAFLNLAMLMMESERARLLRQAILILAVWRAFSTLSGTTIITDLHRQADTSFLLRVQFPLFSRRQ